MTECHRLTAEALRANLARPLPSALIVDLQPSRRSGILANLLAPVRSRLTFRYGFAALRLGFWQHRAAEQLRTPEFNARLKAGEQLQARLRADLDEATDIRVTALRARFLRHHWRENGASARIAAGLAMAMADTQRFLDTRHQLIMRRAA